MAQHMSPAILGLWIFLKLAMVRAQSGPDTTSILLDLLMHSRGELKQQQLDILQPPNQQTSSEHQQRQQIQQQQQLQSRRQFRNKKTTEPGLMQRSDQSGLIPVNIPTKRSRPFPLYAYTIPSWYMYYLYLEHYI